MIAPIPTTDNSAAKILLPEPLRNNHDPIMLNTPTRKDMELKINAEG